MVLPLYLRLFGSRNVDLLPSSHVRLDNWITLNMKGRLAASITALHHTLELIVISGAEDPEKRKEPKDVEEKMMQAVMQLYIIQNERWQS